MTMMLAQDCLDGPHENDNSDFNPSTVLVRIPDEVGMVRKDVETVWVPRNFLNQLCRIKIACHSTSLLIDIIIVMTLQMNVADNIHLQHRPVNPCYLFKIYPSISVKSS